MIIYFQYDRSNAVSNIVIVLKKIGDSPYLIMFKISNLYSRLKIMDGKNLKHYSKEIRLKSVKLTGRPFIKFLKSCRCTFPNI